MPKRFALLALLAGCQPAPATPPAVSFQAQVVPVLRAHCARCHVVGGTGPFAMFDADGTPRFQTVHDRIRTVVEAIETKYMPLDAPGSVTAAEIQVLRAWRDAQAPNN
jgi:hypothetical protein